MHDAGAALRATHTHTHSAACSPPPTDPQTHLGLLLRLGVVKGAADEALCRIHGVGGVGDRLRVRACTRHTAATQRAQARGRGRRQACRPRGPGSIHSALLPKLPRGPCRGRCEAAGLRGCRPMKLRGRERQLCLTRPCPTPRPPALHCTASFCSTGPWPAERGRMERAPRTQRMTRRGHHNTPHHFRSPPHTRTHTTHQHARGGDPAANAKAATY